MKTYFYNYLKDYILENGERIVGFNKNLLKDKEALEQFLEARAQLATEEYERYEDAHGGGRNELAMEVLLADLKELEPDEEEKEAEALYQKERAEEERMLRESGYYDV